MAAYTTLQDIVVVWSGRQGPPPTLLSLAISPLTPSVAKGLKQQFQALGTMSDGSQVDYTALATWTSGTGTVATINSSGLATTLTTGTSSIGASVGAITATNVTLTVTVAVIASIALTPSPSTVAKGLTQQYVATATFTDSTTSDVSSTATWVSSNTAVATVSATGLATSLTVGTTNITAAKSSVTSPNDVFTVTAAVIASIAVTPSAPSVALGLTQQFTATATFTDSSTLDVSSTATWLSSVPAKATISASGLATTVAQGTTNITAAQAGVTSPTDILTVAAPALVSIAVTPVSPSVAAPATQQFAATGTFTDLSTSDITTTSTWLSSSTGVATIGSTTGLATSVAAGTTNITATKSSITSPNDVMTVTSAAFDPTSLTGLLVWLDGSKASSINAGSPANSDPVSAWNDLSGNANHGSQATSGLRMTYQTAIQNGLSAILGNRAAGAYVQLANDPVLMPNGSWTVIFVGRCTSTAQQIPIASILSTGVSQSPTIDYFSSAWHCDHQTSGSYNGATFASTTMTTSTNYKLQFLCTTATSTATNFTLRMNGSETAGSANATLGFASVNHTTIGCDAGDAGFGWAGYIYEVIAYNRLLNSTERGQIDTYILNKWGF